MCSMNEFGCMKVAFWREASNVVRCMRGETNNMHAKMNKGTGETIAVRFKLRRTLLCRQ